MTGVRFEVMDGYVQASFVGVFQERVKWAIENGGHVWPELFGAMIEIKPTDSSEDAYMHAVANALTTLWRCYESTRRRLLGLPFDETDALFSCYRPPATMDLIRADGKAI